MEDKKRIEFIDLAKGICIILVVVVHIVPEFGHKFQFLGCIRMPLYFCLSGLFYKNYGGFKIFVLKKINKILVPFIAWYFIGYGIYYIGRFISPSGSVATFHISDVIYKNEIFNLPIWFLMCLFLSNMWFFIVELISKKWSRQFLGVLLFTLLGWLMIEANIKNFLYIGSSMTCMPFFYFGYILKKTKILYPTDNKKIDFVIMMCAFLCASLFAFTSDMPPKLGYYKNIVDYGNPFQIYICAMSFIVGILILCKFINYLPYVSWLGRYSIMVLVTHMWLNDIFSIGLKRVVGLQLSQVCIELIVLMIVLVSMCVVIPFCKRWLPYITAQKEIIKVY